MLHHRLSHSHHQSQVQLSQSLLTSLFAYQSLQRFLQQLLLLLLLALQTEHEVRVNLSSLGQIEALHSHLVFLLYSGQQLSKGSGS